MNEPSFVWRAALLLGLMLVISGVDWFRHGGAATKYREYGFIIVTGMLGAAVGAANDTITSSLSPEYFVLGKGIAEGVGFRWRVVVYGLQVGFSAGVIAGAVCLFFARKKPALPFDALYKMLWIPVIAAAAGGVLGSQALFKLDPANLSSQLHTILDVEKTGRFLRAWWTHAGLYAGLITGVAIMIGRIRRARKLISQ